MPPKRVTFLAALGLALALAAGARAQDPTLACVRIKSHGASGTVIATTRGKSWILSCAHMFLDGDNRPSAALRDAMRSAEPKKCNKKNTAESVEASLRVIHARTVQSMETKTARIDHRLQRFFRRGYFVI